MSRVHTNSFVRVIVLSQSPVFIDSVYLYFHSFCLDPENVAIPLILQIIISLAISDPLFALSFLSFFMLQRINPLSLTPPSCPFHYYFFLICSILMPWTLLSSFLSLQPSSIDTSSCHWILIFKGYTLRLRTSASPLFGFLPLTNTWLCLWFLCLRVLLYNTLVPVLAADCLTLSGVENCAALCCLSSPIVPHLLVWWSVTLIISTASFSIGLSWPQDCESFPTVVISHLSPLKI